MTNDKQKQFINGAFQLAQQANDLYNKSFLFKQAFSEEFASGKDSSIDPTDGIM